MGPQAAQQEDAVMPKRRPFSRLVTLLCGAALAAALAAPAAAQSTLRVKPFSDLRNLDPVTTTDYAVRNHGYMVYDTLFSVDERLQLRPQMVERWETSADGLTWTFTLRDGLAFHDGRPVTSEDVVASLRRWAARDGHGQLLTARLSALEQVDARTFRIVLTRPWGLLLDALGKPSSLVPFIMPARIAATAPTTNITDPIGSGPFVMRRDLWVSGSRIVYDRNPAYRPRSEAASGLAGGKRAGFDRVEWVIIPDATTAAGALQRGEIDIFEDVPPDLVPLLTRRPGVRVVPQDNVGQHMVLRMNHLQPPFNNPALRQAVLHAVDPANFVRAFTDNPELGRTCAGFFTCVSPYATEAGWPRPDLARARSLVRDSGYDGTPVVILQATDLPNLNAFAQVADQMFREIGLRTRLDAMDWATVASRRMNREPVANGGWSVFLAGPSGLDAMDPLPHFALRAAGADAWPGWPQDAEMERLREAFADARDGAERRRIAEQMQRRAVEVVPYVPVGQLALVRGLRSNLSGVLTAPVNVYWNITRD
jgi:peptide/nickel transport system substrate-binding protein